MKTAFTDIDREAARLFKPAGGMLAGWRGSKDGAHPVWERLLDSTQATPDAFDTDDPATVGAMLAQAEAKNCAPLDLLANYPPDPEWHFINRNDGDGVSQGPTRGAALVAAMRTLRDEV